MRFVNVVVSDIAALLRMHAFDTRSAAVERIRKRGGIRWRPGNTLRRRRFDEFACLRQLPSSRMYCQKLSNHSSMGFVSGKDRELVLCSVEDGIQSDALAANLNVNKRFISSFVNTELGKAVETEVIDKLEKNNSYQFSDKQQCYTKTWAHPKQKSIKVHVVGRVDAEFCDDKRKTGILEIKCRRRGFIAFRRHEIIQLRIYLTLAERDYGILLQDSGGKFRKKRIRRDDNWFYSQVKPTIDKIALQVANTKKGQTPKRCRSKGKG